MMEIFTIGVYNSTEEVFFDKLVNNQIDLFVDIRRRRGVRGSQYAFVNSTYLQKKLANLGIPYKHILELSPTREIREAQWKEDARLGETKKQRKSLGSIFIERYIRDILTPFDFNAFYEQLIASKAKRVVLFCVEENSQACHRSLVAAQMNRLFNTPIKNL